MTTAAGSADALEIITLSVADGIAAEAGGATRLEAAHNGYAARFGLTHRRILILRDDGTELRGED